LSKALLSNSGGSVKLRRLPEDFQVDEQTDFELSGGPFAVYRLTKQSIGTPEAIAAIVERWKVPRRRISYGGLKDRHAITSQHLTIQHGPKKPLRQSSFELSYLGQAERPFQPADITANQFRIVMRHMNAAAAESAEQAAVEVSRSGLPNYFDDQRFGSLAKSGEWIARAWCLGDWERALWLALADPHRDDRSKEKEQKRILREFWGRWVECKQALSRSHRRSIVTYMADREAVDIRGAFTRLSVDLRGLYLSAYQSAIWNRVLNRLVEQQLSPTERVAVRLLSGPCAFFRTLPSSASDLSEMDLPLPSARLKLPDGPLLELIQSVVAEEDLELRQLRVKYPRDSFFSKASRRAVVQADGLVTEADDDELYPNSRKLQLTFQLPRGSYATVLVKRVGLGNDEGTTKTET
jgi:tRNA pseudouridine13 synthase